MPGLNGDPDRNRAPVGTGAVSVTGRTTVSATCGRTSIAGSLFTTGRTPSTQELARNGGAWLRHPPGGQSCTGSCLRPDNVWVARIEREHLMPGPLTPASRPLRVDELHLISPFDCDKVRFWPMQPWHSRRRGGWIGAAPAPASLARAVKGPVDRRHFVAGKVQLTSDNTGRAAEQDSHLRFLL